MNLAITNHSEKLLSKRLCDQIAYIFVAMLCAATEQWCLNVEDSQIMKWNKRIWNNYYEIST